MPKQRNNAARKHGAFSSLLNIFDKRARREPIKSTRRERVCDRKAESVSTFALRCGFLHFTLCIPLMKQRIAIVIVILAAAYYQ